MLEQTVARLRPLVPADRIWTVTNAEQVSALRKQLPAASRKRALVENGRRAIRLIAAATVLLLVAGTLEGFVSPIPSWSLGEKLAVSGATLILLIVYLSSGRERKRVATRTPAHEPEELLALQ